MVIDVNEASGLHLATTIGTRLNAMELSFHAQQAAAQDRVEAMAINQRRLDQEVERVRHYEECQKREADLGMMRHLHKEEMEAQHQARLADRLHLQHLRE